MEFRDTRPARDRARNVVAREASRRRPQRRRFIGFAAAALFAAAGAARAANDATYPNRPIHCILPSTPGGTSDLLARVIAPHLGDALGQPLVIEARPGAAGRIAVDHVANAPPDGYTLLLGNNGANAIVPGGRGTPVVDAAPKLVAVTMLARLPIVIVATPASGIDSLAALVARAKSVPGRLSYGSGGVGSTSQMAAVRLMRSAGIDLVHVPYAGTSAAVKDVLSGDVDVLFTHAGTVNGLVQAGQLRALAVTGDRRSASLPKVPTVAEAGYAGFEVTTWHGVLAPPGTPHEIVARLDVELRRVLAIAEVRRQLETLGMEPVGDPPEEFAAAIDADIRRWHDLIRTHRIATP
jgi:tripartite-type tricarboxylate transporter receptor subunit TctC